MTMPNDNKGNVPAVAAVEPAKPPATAPPIVDPKAVEKIYSQVEADGMLKAQYDKTNVTLSQQGVELAKLRPMEADNETLRTRVRTLEDEADTARIEGSRGNPTDLELQQGTRQLRVDTRTHEDVVRAHNIKVAEFAVKEGNYNTWNDQHNMENENSIAFIADKFKVKPEELKDIPVEGRSAFAERLAGTQPAAAPVAVPAVVSSLIEDGRGQGGEQLTGNAAAEAALARARERQKS